MSAPAFTCALSFAEPVCDIILSNKVRCGRFLAEHALAARGIVVGCSRDESDLRHDHYEHRRVAISDESAVIQFFSNVRKKHGRARAPS